MTTETEKDWPFPWDKVEGIYQSDGPKKPTRVEIDQVWYFVSPTGDDGIDTNRARQFVACLTCNEIVHHNTTGPSSRILHHHRNEHTAATPKMVGRGRIEISLGSLMELPTPTDKEKDHFQSKQQWREWVPEGWRILWWENDPDDGNKRLIVAAWAVGADTGRWLDRPFEECVEGRLPDGVRCWLPRGHSESHRDYPVTTEEITRMRLIDPKEITRAYKMLPPNQKLPNPLLDDELPAVGDKVTVHVGKDGDTDNMMVCEVEAVATSNFCVRLRLEGRGESELLTLWEGEKHEKWFPVKVEKVGEWVDLTGAWRHLETGLRFNVIDDSNDGGFVTLYDGVGTPTEIKREEFQTQYKRVDPILRCLEKSGKDIQCNLVVGHAGRHEATLPGGRRAVFKTQAYSVNDGPQPIKNIALLMKFNQGVARIDNMRALVAVADRMQIPAEADFNGVNVFAMPGDDVESLDKNLLLALEQKEKFAMADRKRN